MALSEAPNIVPFANLVILHILFDSWNKQIFYWAYEKKYLLLIKSFNTS